MSHIFSHHNSRFNVFHKRQIIPAFKSLYVPSTALLSHLLYLSPSCHFPHFVSFQKKTKKTPCAVRTCWAKFTSQQSQARVGPTGCVRVINHDSHLPSCDYQLLNLCERPRDGNSHMACKSEAGMLFECKLQQDLCPEWRCVWRILLCCFFFNLFLCTFPAAFKCIQTQQKSTLHGQASVYILQIHNWQWCENDQSVTAS